MTRPLKPATARQKHDLDLAVWNLERARDLLKAAGATKTLERVRLALTSAQGAQRHMYRRLTAEKGDQS